MAHIHTQQGQHDHTASAYIVRQDDKEPKIMFHLHKKVGKYLQFGGHIELHETPWQAITHELQEEVGYDIDQLAILQPHDRLQNLTNAVLHPQPVSHSTHPFAGSTDHFHTDIGYVFVTSQPPNHAPQDSESTDIILLTRSELAAMPPQKMPANVREIGLYIFDHCLENWEAVTTATFK